MEVVAEATGGEEAVRLASSSRPDVAIIDIAMPKAIARKVLNRFVPSQDKLTRQKPFEILSDRERDGSPQTGS